MAPRPDSTQQDPTIIQGWRPNPGDEVIGVMVDGAVAHGAWGSYPVLTLQQDSEPGAKDGAGARVDIHCFHDVLQRRMMELRPQHGERVRVRYLGTKKSQDDRRTISLYTVEVAGRGVDPFAAFEREQMQAVMAGQAPAPQAAVVPAEPSQAELPPVERPGAPADDIPF